MQTIILAGGRGTRLWPLSRDLYPKQFIKIFDDESFFIRTVKRSLIHSKPGEILITSNKDFKFLILKDLDDANIDIPEENILLEPQAKNTLPAIFWGVKKIREAHGKSKVIILPSDHLVEEGKGYDKSIRKADKMAETHLVTFGVPPTNPNTGYGYIKPGKELGDGFKVDEFKEKPDLDTAKKYVQEGYLWNSGMFVFDTEIFQEAVGEHASEVSVAFEKPVDEAYNVVPGISVDYGLMEKAENVGVIAFETRWDDIGSFDSIYDVFGKNEDGNVVRGESINVGSKNNLVLTDKLTAVVGLEDTIVVDTGDALLVAGKGHTQQINEVHRYLMEKSDERAKLHLTDYRPWGSYTVLEDGERYKIKQLLVYPGKKLSLQRHQHRSEHWIVIAGTAGVVVGEEEKQVKKGGNVFIPKKTKHRLFNPGTENVEIIEIQTGDYFGEDDIERFEDDYGRV